jgi:hypothetical protein
VDAQAYAFASAAAGVPFVDLRNPAYTVYVIGIESPVALHLSGGLKQGKLGDLRSGREGTPRSSPRSLEHYDERLAGRISARRGKAGAG